MQKLFKNIKVLCKKHNISIRRLEKELGFPASTIYKWKENATNYNNVIKIANYFNVSTDYLLGLTDDPTLKNYKNFELKFINSLYYSLNESDRNKMYIILKEIFKN